MSRREEVEDLDDLWTVPMVTQKSGVAGPCRGVATEHQDSLRLPPGESNPEVFAETGAWWVGDDQGTHRQVAGVGDKSFGSVADDLCSGKIAARRHCRFSIRFDQSQVAFGREASRSGEKPDPCVEVENRRRIAANEFCNAPEQGINEEAIALEKGTDRPDERNR